MAGLTGVDMNFVSVELAILDSARKGQASDAAHGSALRLIVYDSD